VTEQLHVLVTGGAGFIGSHLVDRLLMDRNVRVTVLDKLTYAGNMSNLEAHEGNERFSFVRGDIVDPDAVNPLVKDADRVINAAAESFVDRSIDDASEFILTNIVGTHVVLEACRSEQRALLQVSTDEVYGSTRAGAFGEEDPLRPNSPYSATKASADLLCRAYHETYGVPVSVVRGSNAYGPRQHPEKAIPTFARAALRGQPLPVYGSGSNRREWLYVEDFVKAIDTVMRKGESGHTYNIGGGHEIANLLLARMVCSIVEVPESLIAFVPDRPGHDLRYALKWEPLARLGWNPQVAFHLGLASTIEWYRENEDWSAAMLEERKG